MERFEERLSMLESEARKLEPDTIQRAELLTAVDSYASAFLDRLSTMKAYQRETAAMVLEPPPIAEDPVTLDRAIEYLDLAVDKPGINPASGGHMGYIPGGGIYGAALGDYLADVFNRYAGVMFASAGAVRLEKYLLRWMASLFGFPLDCAGDLTSGGSMANLIGLVAAREAKQIGSDEITKSVIYLSRQVHHSVDKSIRIVGLRDCVIRHLSLDENYRIDPAALQKQLELDRRAGLNPWLLVASAGTTDVGAIDPLPELADICKRTDLWFHVDAAYGGFFVLCNEASDRLLGMSAADSVVMDPHKGLFLPYGSGAVLVRDQKAMQRAFHYEANYMQDATRDVSMTSPADLSPELSRPFRGLRLWLPLMIHGLAPFRAALSEKLLLAEYFYEKINAMHGFETGPRPQLSVVTYRYVPAAGDADEFNLRLVDRIHQDGRVFVSSTRIDGRIMLRLAILNFRTHRDEVDLILEILGRSAAELEAH